MLESLLKRAPSVPWTMDALEGRRQAIAAAHARGASGVETVTALTALADDILRDLYALEYAGTFSPAVVVLVALGGYGRRELAPYSDIDLMFLYEPLHEREAGAVSAEVPQDVQDRGRHGPGFPFVQWFVEEHEIDVGIGRQLAASIAAQGH